MTITKDDVLQQLRAQPSEAKKQEFLENILKKPLNIDVKITALIALADLFIGKKWFGLAARNYCYAGDLANTFREKIDLYFKGAVLYLRSGDYINAEDNFRKVLVLAANKDKESIKQKILLLYLEHANSYEKEKQYTKAIAAYNRILMMNLPLQKANEIREKLVTLYEKIGRPIEANQMRTQIQRALQDAEQQTQGKKLERQFNAEDFL